MDDLLDRDDHEREQRPRVTTERTTPFWRSLMTGSHSSTTTVPPIPGVEGTALARQAAETIGGNPMIGARVTPSQMPQPARTLGQPISVSTASSQDDTSHNVMVESGPEHILSPRDGSAAGINYGVEPTPDGGATVSKESYGQGPLAPLRSLFGNFVVDPHTRGNLQEMRDRLEREQLAKGAPTKKDE